jgi:hypothetical protein
VNQYTNVYTGIGLCIPVLEFEHVNQYTNVYTGIGLCILVLEFEHFIHFLLLANVRFRENSLTFYIEKNNGVQV